MTNAYRSSRSDDRMHEDTCNLRTLMFKNKSSHQLNSIDLFTCSLYGLFSHFQTTWWYLMRTFEFFQIPPMHVHPCCIYMYNLWKDKGQIPWRTSHGLNLERLNLSSPSGQKKLSIINGLPGSWCMHHVFFFYLNLVWCFVKFAVWPSSQSASVYI